MNRTVFTATTAALAAANAYTLDSEMEFFRPHWAVPGLALKDEYMSLNFSTTSECECRKHCMLRARCLR